jgi:hypothetical protein
MAELIKREYDIIVLKAQVGVHSAALAGSRESLVRFTLQYHEERRLVDGPRWEFPLNQIAPPALDRSMTRGTGPPMQLPTTMLTELRDWFDSNTERKQPLWVHLVKPYGLLRIVPWERLLGEALDIPILMLPDFIFPPPREAMQVLDVVLCGSAPLGYEEYSVLQAMRQAADRILASAAASRRVRLHVFADRDIAEPLSREWKADGRLGSSITVHGHDRAAPYITEDLPSRLIDEAGTLRSPWLLWMRDALAGAGVDVIHFICHAYLARERGALMFAQSPLERTDRYLAGPVSAAELGTFLTQVGAWSTVFTSLPDNHSELGLRWLADEIAQSRPGPMMMHSVSEDPGAEALEAGYGFLYNIEPQEPPTSKALFIYCQPYLQTGAVRGASADIVLQQAGGIARATLGSPASIDDESPIPPFPVPWAIARNPYQQQAAILPLESSPLDPFFAAEHVSSLVASTERFVEQVQLRYQQLERDELVPRSSGKAAEVRAAFDTLAKLRAAVGDIESRSPTDYDDTRSAENRLDRDSSSESLA